MAFRTRARPRGHVPRPFQGAAGGSSRAPRRLDDRGGRRPGRCRRVGGAAPRARATSAGRALCARRAFGRPVGARRRAVRERRNHGPSPRSTTSRPPISWDGRRRSFRSGPLAASISSRTWGPPSRIRAGPRRPRPCSRKQSNRHARRARSATRSELRFSCCQAGLPIAHGCGDRVARRRGARRRRRVRGDG